MKRKESFVKKMVCCIMVMFFSFSTSTLPTAIAKTPQYNDLHQRTLLSIDSHRVRATAAEIYGKNNKRSLLGKRTLRGPEKESVLPIMVGELDETIEVKITPEIKALSSSLDNDAVKMFWWVLNNIDHEPYYGSMKGASETLSDMAGNDYDQSSLLIALLRASKIPSVYIERVLEIEIADLMNWIGGAQTPEMAIRILERNRIPITSVVYDGEEIRGVRLRQVCVRAFFNEILHDLNPSFKAYSYSSGVGYAVDPTELEDVFSNNVIFDGNTFTVNQDVINAYHDTQTANMKGAVEHLTTDEVFGTRTIIADHQPDFRITYRWRDLFARIPSSRQHKVKIILRGRNDYTTREYVTSIPEIASKRLSLVFTAATPQDQEKIDANGSIFFSPYPADNVFMVPTLQIDGKTVCIGDKAELGTGGHVDVGILTPQDTHWEFVPKSTTVGSRYNISIMTQNTSRTKYERVIKELEADVEKSGLEEHQHMTNEMIDKSLYLTGLLYWSTADKYAKILSNHLDVVSVRHVSVGFFVNDIAVLRDWFGSISETIRGTAYIHLGYNRACPTSTIGGDHIENEALWTKLYCGTVCSLERTILGSLYEFDAISAETVFREANRLNIDIHTFTDVTTLEDDLSKLTRISSGIKDHIRQAVHKGHLVAMPEHLVTFDNWAGIAVMSLDEETGKTGYVIFYRYNRGATLNDYTDDLILSVLLFLKGANDVGKISTIGGAISLTGGCQIYSAYVIQTTAIGVPLVLTAPFVAGYAVLGATLVGIGFGVTYVLCGGGDRLDLWSNTIIFSDSRPRKGSI